MAIEIKVPQFPESVEEGSIATWHKQVGEEVTRDELVVDIETDKTVLEVVATEDGVLTDILKQDGDTVLSQELIGKIESGTTASGSIKSDKTSPTAVASREGRRPWRVRPLASASTTAVLPFWSPRATSAGVVEPARVLRRPSSTKVLMPVRMATARISSAGARWKARSRTSLFIFMNSKIGNLIGF